MDIPDKEWEAWKKATMYYFQDDPPEDEQELYQLTIDNLLAAGAEWFNEWT